jgi:hypothetical protein
MDMVILTTCPSGVEMGASRSDVKRSEG